MLATLGIGTRELSEVDGLDSLHCTTCITSKSLQTTAMHYLRTNCLVSGLLLEFVKSAAILEQPMKGPVAITQSMLNMLINKTQDISDKILLSFSQSKYFHDCSCYVTMPTHNVLPSYLVQTGSLSSHS
jgi:hypothetical protein